ncbi:hypothetical protein [Polyangium aurulentum]|uniref:hypothetical protein n=1 Tax=Polyangium aurulentum TaxID=2567896 RepID=UPI0010AECA95|nr:hypothetical protein [Polyangium aurulentum]UQA58469.1 hypothetical protein E8A73_045700 [Polyangium aurulentum]
MRHGANRRKLHGPLALALFLGLFGGCLELDTESISCKTVADCPSSGECGVWTCKEESCVVDAKPSGTVPTTQVPGDCKRLVCDGNGNAVSEPSNEDTASDGTPCTTDKCVDGTPTYAPAPAGTACGVGNQLECNGAGACVGCTVGSDCGPEEPCATWLCEAGTCKRVLKASGTFVEDPALGDCKGHFCDAIGQVVAGAYDSDVMDDGNPCTTDACSNGAEIHEPVPAGTSCGTGCQMCVDAVCAGCDKLPDDYACNTQLMQCTPLKELENGSACTSQFDCVSKLCIDGVCCDSLCDGPCTACNSAKTGQPNGTCSPITAGTDPDNDCQSPAADVCVAGQCQCYNGIKDGAELKVDCGGNCAPCPGTWVCDGSPACESAPNSTCCNPFCGICMDNSAGCKQLHGTPCVIGTDQPKQYSLKLTSTPECNAKSSQACVFSLCTCK